MPAGWEALPINAEFQGHSVRMYSQPRIGRPKGRKPCIISNDLRTNESLLYIDIQVAPHSEHRPTGSRDIGKLLLFILRNTRKIYAV
jgi:hypothetical protein